MISNETHKQARGDATVWFCQRRKQQFPGNIKCTSSSSGAFDSRDGVLKGL